MNWRLARTPPHGAVEIEIRDPDDQTWGYSLLHELARDPRNGLHEIGPGVYVGASENTGRPTDR